MTKTKIMSNNQNQFVMKTAISIFLVWTITSAYASDPLVKKPIPGATKGETGFKLVKQANDICIFTRWIPVDENRSARQVKVEFTINAPADSALSVILDDDSFTTWMKGTRDYHRVQTMDSSNWYSYIQFSIPWPLNDQDCIIRYSVRKNSETYTEVFLHGEPDYLAPVKGIKRISHMQGSWKLLAVSPERTVVEYTIFSNQPSSFPKWITDPIIQNNMIRTMSAFREQVTAN